MNTHVSVAHGRPAPSPHHEAIEAFANDLIDDTLALPYASKPRIRAKQAIEARIVKHFQTHNAATGGACALLAAMFAAQVAPSDLADEAKLKARCPDLVVPISIIVREHRRAVAAAPAPQAPPVIAKPKTPPAAAAVVRQQTRAPVVAPAPLMAAMAIQAAAARLRPVAAPAPAIVPPPPPLPPQPVAAPQAAALPPQAAVVPAPPPLPPQVVAAPKAAALAPQAAVISPPPVRHTHAAVVPAFMPPVLAASQQGRVATGAVLSAGLHRRREIAPPRAPTALMQLSRARVPQARPTPTPMINQEPVVLAQAVVSAARAAPPQAPTQARPMGSVNNPFSLAAAAALQSRPMQDGSTNPFRRNQQVQGAEAFFAYDTTSQARPMPQTTFRGAPRSAEKFLTPASDAATSSDGTASNL